MTHGNDLENLRKRAKQLVRQHRAGDFELPERMRRSLPRFAAMSDRDALAAPFALHDAQELLAREHGFATWADLKEAPPVTTTDATTGARVVSAQPQVFVRDIDRAVAHYRDVLGFDVLFTYGSPPFYAGLQRGGAGLNLRHTDTSPWRDPPEEDELLAAAITTTDAKAIYLELKAAGADIAVPLETPAWGGRHFIVRDLDGNLLHFASPGEV